MTAVSDAEKAVEEAREALLRRLAITVGTYDHARDEALVDALIAAVRRHDAETLLAQPDARKYGRGQWAADRINPKETR